MKNLKIELIYDLDCPNVEAMRGQLSKALAESKIDANWKEWDRNSEQSPEYARKYGSPTLLINGKDISGQEESDENCCRVYLDKDGMKKVPSVEMIRKVLKSNK